MRIIHYPTATTGPYAATIGFFDGVHMGHRFLIGQLHETARERGLQSMVITFERHPRQVVQSHWQPQLLSSLDERIRLLSTLPIDVLVVLPFDEAMARLSAREFMDSVLREKLGVKTLLTGYDNRFGHDRTEGFADYQRYGQELGIEVTAGRPCDVDEQRVSSSLVRRLLLSGDVCEAARCLGRPYELSGRVVHGEQIGRQLGYPTANLQLDDAHRLIPATGVYAVDVILENNDRVYRGMMNIGTRPTFEGHRQTLETHIFDFNGDLYDQRLSIRLLRRLRSERPFETADLLRRQMAQDEREARRA